MAKARIVCNRNGLLALAGYAPMLQILTFVDWQGRGWDDTLSQDSADRIVDREGGRFASRPTNYFVRVDSDEISLSDLQAMFSVINTGPKNVEVLQWPAFVKLPDSAVRPEKDIQSNVPLYMLNSLVGEDRVKWQDWKDVTHEHLSLDGYTYIPTNSNTDANDTAVSTLIKLVEDGYDVQPMSVWPNQDV